MDGKGNQALGAPNLTDDIWLHGWGEQGIVAMINKGTSPIVEPGLDELPKKVVSEGHLRATSSCGEANELT